MKKLLISSLIVCLGTNAYSRREMYPKLGSSIDAWGTHFSALANVITHTNGPILQLGSGDYSTPMLHNLCSPTKRKLVSTDTSKAWLDLFLNLEKDWHTFIYVPVYSDDNEKNPKPEMWDTIGGHEHWSVVFVDHKPAERRKTDIERLRPNTDIFVVHDSQAPAYDCESILKTFKYRYVYERYHVTTTIVSDTIDVERFFEQ